MLLLLSPSMVWQTLKLEFELNLAVSSPISVSGTGRTTSAGRPPLKSGYYAAHSSQTAMKNYCTPHVFYHI